MFNNNSSKGQTTIELLLILTVSVVILAIIYSIYADQFTGNVSSTELFLARSSVQKIVNASNTAYLSGIGSIIKVEVDFPSSVDFDNSKLSSNIISLKLLGGLDVVGIADINFGGSLRKQYGKQVIYLVFDGNSVNLEYLDFELNQYNISFSTNPNTTRKETISIRNNSSQEMIFFITNNFPSSGVSIDLNEDSFTLQSNEIKYLDINFNIAQNALGNYSGNLVLVGQLNDINTSKTISLSVEVLLVVEELMIYPLNTNFSVIGDTIVEKSFSICNKSLINFENISWSAVGSADGNIISWIDNFGDLESINDINSGTCENVILLFNILVVGFEDYSASITANYINSQNNISSYTSFLTINVIGTTNYFKSVSQDTLNTNYFLSSLVKKTSNEIIPTGELDWNNLARNDTVESMVDNNLIYYGRELDSTNYLFDENLIGLWHLNNDLVDSTGNNIAGTNYSVDLEDTGFWNTNSAYFSGTTYANFPYNSDFDFQQTSPFTISAWVRIDDLSRTNGYIVNNRQTLNVSYAGWSLRQGTNNVYGAIGGYPGSYAWWESSAPIELGWNHIIYVNTGVAGEQKIYVNGDSSSSVSSESGDITLTYNSNAKLTFGKSPADGAGHFFKGGVEEVAIWNRALSEEEVESLYYSQQSSFRDDVVGLWHLDGDANDSSNSGFDGTWGGTESYDTGLWSTSSASFDGLSNINMGDVLNIGLEDMTISTWINTSETTSSSQYIISKARAASQNNRFAFRVVSTSTPDHEGKIGVIFSWNLGGHVEYYGNTRVNDGKWHNIVIVINRSSNLEIYVDGKLDGVQDISNYSSLNVVSNNPFRIGSYTNSDNITPSAFFIGEIEEVVVYNRALSENEVKENYNQQKGDWLEKDLVAYYKFNEASGTTIYDSARSYNGVLMNGATIDENGLWDSNAANFDGADDYVDLENIYLDSNNPFSINAWFYSNNDNSNGGIFVTAKEDGKRNALIITSNNVLSLIVLYPVDNTSYTYSTTSNVFSNNEWNHVVANWDGVDVKIFVNGVEYSTTKGVAVSNSSANINFIGRNNWGDGVSNSYFNGLIDEVKIYDRTLTEEEIILDYNNFLSAKFVDSNIVDAEEIVSWNSLKINSELNYNFGNEIESFSDLKEKGINELGSGSNADYLVDENLIGLWHLNDKNSEGWVLNSATNIRDGQLYNGADVSAIGLWDTNAGFFDGANDYLNINDDDSLEPTDITVSLWIYSKSWTHNSVATSLISKRSIATNGYFIFYLTGSSSIQWDWCGPTQNRWNTGYNPPLNTWVNLIFVRNSSGRYLYVDGKLYNSTTVAGDSSNIPSTATLKIGNDNSGYPFDGFIEEVTIWNRPLDEEEVSELYDSQKADYADSLVGLWHLNDNAEDSSGNNNGFWSGSETYDTGLWETNSGNFNGSSFVSVSSSNFSSPISRTISAWINTTSTVSGGNTIMSRIQSVSPYAGFTLNVGRNTAGRLAYFSGSAWRESDSTNYNTGEWIHVVVVHDDTDITIYRNGVKDGTFTGVAISSFDTNFLIGKEREGALRLFNGKIEEVAIWNRALSAEEVSDLFETSSKKIDLEVFSCSDALCENKTSTQEILNAKNNHDYDLTLSDSRYLGWQAYFKKIDGLEYVSSEKFLEMPFIIDVTVTSIND